MFMTKIFAIFMMVAAASALPTKNQLQALNKRLINVGCDSTDGNLLSLTLAGIYIEIPGSVNVCDQCLIAPLSIVGGVVNILESLPVVSSLVNVCPVQTLLKGVDLLAIPKAVRDFCGTRQLISLSGCSDDLLSNLLAAVGELAGGLVGGLTGGLTSGLVSGLTSGLTGGLTSGLTSGLTGGLTGGAVGGLTGGLTGGAAGGLTSGLTGGAAGGLTGGLTGGAAGGLTGGLTGGAAGGLTGGLTGKK